MSRIKLFWTLGSQPARSVKTLMDIGKIKFDLVEVDLRNNETRKA